MDKEINELQKVFNAKRRQKAVLKHKITDISEEIRFIGLWTKWHLIVVPILFVASFSAFGINPTTTTFALCESSFIYSLSAGIAMLGSQFYKKIEKNKLKKYNHDYNNLDLECSQLEQALQQENSKTLEPKETSVNPDSVVDVVSRKVSSNPDVVADVVPSEVSSNLDFIVDMVSDGENLQGGFAFQQQSSEKGKGPVLLKREHEVQKEKV